jgi:hypothetical protein
MTVLAATVCTVSLDLDEAAQPALLGDDEAASKRARAAHDRVDRLLLGRAQAARKRVHRLLGEQAEAALTARPVVAPESPVEREAAAQAVAVRGRVAALLTAS